jgi:hypothetical protein
LKRVRWPLNFKPSGIEKYDGSTNLAEWLEVYQLAIEAVAGGSYVMANYLSICLSSSARTWLLGLPVGSVCSWSDLCQLFTSNFHKLAMKNPRMSEAMFTIANKYTLAEEATLDTREQKKEKHSCHVDPPSSSKGHDKKRKADHSVNAVERS